jgi:hypothetical protein
MKVHVMHPSQRSQIQKPTPALKSAFVVSHPEMGIYLGSCLGLGWWSALDPVGQDAAATFPDEAAAANYIAQLVEHGHWREHEFSITPVMADYGGYATIGEIARVGLPAWNPNA